MYVFSRISANYTEYPDKVYRNQQLLHLSLNCQAFNEMPRNCTYV